MYEEESRLTASVGACEESSGRFLPCEFVCLRMSVGVTRVERRVFNHLARL